MSYKLFLVAAALGVMTLAPTTASAQVSMSGTTSPSS